VRHWMDAAIGRRNVARSLRLLGELGFQVRDILADSESAQHSDRLIVGAQGVYVVGFRTPRGNSWRGATPQAAAEALAGHAQATHRLADVVAAALRNELGALHVRVVPLLTLIGPEPADATVLGGVPVVGPTSLVDRVITPRPVLSDRQVSDLVGRIDDWLARRNASGLAARTASSRHGGRGRSGSL
jgi:hypothetical protein